MRIIDIIDFIEKNDSKGMFNVWPSHLEKAMEIDRAVRDGTMFYATDQHNKISGMILAEKIESEKVIFVTKNLSMNMANLKTFARMAKEKWPDYTLRWIKNGIPKFHSTDRVYKKLAHI